jgi:integrase
VWKKVLQRLKIQYRGFHHLRHTYATLALGAGVPVHVVSKVLGHARASTTLDIYAHVLEHQQTAAKQAMARLFA